MSKQKDEPKVIEDQDATHVISVRVSQEQLKSLQKRAEEVGAETISDYVRDLILKDLPIFDII